MSSWGLAFNFEIWERDWERGKNHHHHQKKIPQTFAKIISGFVNADGKERKKLIVRGKVTVLVEQASVSKNSTATLEGKSGKCNLNK